MTKPQIRPYALNSPQAAGRVLAAAALTNGEIKAAEWARMAETDAFQRLGLQGLQWHAVVDELWQDLMGSSAPGAGHLIDAGLLQRCMAEIDDVALQSLVVELSVEVIEADGEVHPGESLVLRAALESWVLPVEAQQRVEALLCGLDFQVLPRQGLCAAA